MKIGILKEKEPEKRVAMLPDGVADLVKLKVSVIVEKDAGAGSFADDNAYRESGAAVDTRDAVLKGSNIILMINAPDRDTIKRMKEGQVVVAAVNPLVNHDVVTRFAESGVTLFSLDVLPRTTRAQAMDILSSQATVAGYKAVLDAACRLNGFLPMFMSAAGTIKPSRVLVLGAGVAGLQAIATARKLGAVVEAFDVRSAVKEEVQSLGAKFVEVEGAIDDTSAGGYAVEQTEAFKQRQQQMIQEHCLKADIVICTAQIPGRKAPLLVRKETVEAMKPGSVIIDLAASTGGNCALTRNDEVVVVNGVSVVGESNYPSAMPTDASQMFGKNMINFLKLLIDDSGNINLDFGDELVKGTCVTHAKEIMHERVREFMNSKK
ncbi:MAG: Re/Si-specific NAD(P)(+) transhydrogenase subunit alpha [Bacteroidales bacterium]|nr:Re/Si-specific NAD(P)(+) transhydrogenase subunit alpha [Bacteroidales bacterium]MBN2697591.1 Re/Si-specific NAD(P)(+) transhydrogenase subunit alpha [Bacteroidales bacterium]